MNAYWPSCRKVRVDTLLAGIFFTCLDSISQCTLSVNIKFIPIFNFPLHPFRSHIAIPLCSLDPQEWRIIRAGTIFQYLHRQAELLISDGIFCPDIIYLLRSHFRLLFSCGTADCMHQNGPSLYVMCICCRKRNKQQPFPCAYPCTYISQRRHPVKNTRVPPRAGKGVTDENSNRRKTLRNRKLCQICVLPGCHSCGIPGDSPAGYL